jgi:hypothetical protein
LYNIVQHATVANTLGVPLNNVSFRRALVGIKLVEWNDLVARAVNINLQVGQDRFFFLLENNGK